MYSCFIVLKDLVGVMYCYTTLVLFTLAFFLSLEAFGLLVLLSFDISAFTPVAYQRHSL